MLSLQGLKGEWQNLKKCLKLFAAKLNKMTGLGFFAFLTHMTLLNSKTNKMHLLKQLMKYHKKNKEANIDAPNIDHDAFNDKKRNMRS